MTQIFVDTEESTVQQNATLTACVPVTVSPCATLGEITVAAIGNPVITSVACHRCTENEHTFYVRQNIMMQLPLGFTATGEVGQICLASQSGQVDAEPVIIHTSICGDK